jgi:hypothetical protein
LAVPSTEDRSNVRQPPGWAVDRARAELYDVEDAAIIAERAWQLVHQAEQLEDERHDEYDDPDQGGEA